MKTLLEINFLRVIVGTIRHLANDANNYVFHNKMSDDLLLEATEGEEQIIVDDLDVKLPNDHLLGIEEGDLINSEVKEEVNDLSKIKNMLLIFEETVSITYGQPHSLVADGLVNFCMDNIHSGNDTFLQTHRLAGDDLKSACHKFRGVQAGCARITDAYGLNNNFKPLRHHSWHYSYGKYKIS
uniref:Uncharacterized protein n=1 Tax=Panagrolaimus superbus TaxID=310955 RepID=A0A914YV14_9BILA